MYCLTLQVNAVLNTWTTLIIIFEIYLSQSASWIDNNLQVKPFLLADAFHLVPSLVNPPDKSFRILLNNFDTQNT